MHSVTCMCMYTHVHLVLCVCLIQVCLFLTLLQLENDLDFLGFLIMQNALKPETAPTIAQLQVAQVRCVMVTGQSLSSYYIQIQRFQVRRAVNVKITALCNATPCSLVRGVKEFWRNVLCPSSGQKNEYKGASGLRGIIIYKTVIFNTTIILQQQND